MSEANASAGSGFGNILDIAKLLGPMVFGSGKTNTTDTTTTSKTVDAESMDMNKQLFASLGLSAEDAEGTTASMVDRIIEKAAIAFAPIVGEQNKAGLYNSTVLAQLSGQAGAAASKEAASAVLDFKTNQQKLQAAVGGNLLSNGPTTSVAAKQGSSQVAPTIKPGISAALTAAMIAKSAHAMMTKKEEDIAKKAPKPPLSDSAADNLRADESYNPDIDPTNLGANADTAASSAETGSTLESGSSSSSAIESGLSNSSTAADTLIDPASFMIDDAALEGVSTAPALIDTAPLVGEAADAIDLGGESAAAIDEVGNAAAGAEAGAEATVDVSGLAADATDLGFAAEGGADLAGEAFGADLGGDALATLGGDFAFDAAADFGIEEVATAALAWVICTELKQRGELDPALYAAGAAHIKNLPQATINGYHLWAIPYTRWMRRSSFARNFIKPFAVGRTKYLAGTWNTLGFLTVLFGEPACWLLGKIAQRRGNWKSLYQAAGRSI